MSVSSAQMHPSDIFNEWDKVLPYAEIQVYEWLKKLPHECHVFHSVTTMRPMRNGAITNYENDFVIFHPKYGVVVLEVKGGIISTNEDGKLVQENSETHEITILDREKDPLSQALGAINNVYIKSMTEALGNKKPFICPAVFFTGMSRSSYGTFRFPAAYETLKQCGGILVSEHLNEDPEKVLRNIIKAQAGDKCVALSEKDFAKALSVVAGSMNMVGLPFERTGELEYRFELLTKEQASLLDYIQEQRFATIQGSAGTGKTILANLAATRLSEKGHRVLYVCYNRFLKEELCFCHEGNGVVYKDIYSLAYESKGPFDKIDKPEDRANVLYNKNPADYPFDDVIIDEAQDLSAEEVTFLKDIAVQHKGTCYIFYDKNQILYDVNSAEWIVKAECRLVLSRNCRNPKLIGQSSASVLNRKADALLMNTEGDQPLIAFEKSADAFKNTLYHIVMELKSEKHGLKNDDIAILTLKTEDTSLLCGVDSLYGINISKTKEKGSVWFTTARKFKGLERKGIVIIDIDEKAFVDDAMGSNQVFYVACSRATRCLRMLVVGGEDQLKAIADAIAGNPMKPEGKIRSKTKTKVFSQN